MQTPQSSTFDLTCDIAALRSKIKHLQRELNEAKETLASIQLAGNFPSSPGDYSAVLEAIINAGPNGIKYTTLRSVSRAMRRSFEKGALLPSELARAGVTVEKVGKGLRYYAPTF